MPTASTAFGASRVRENAAPPLRRARLGQLSSVVACAVLSIVAGCESYDTLHNHRYRYRTALAGEVRPVARLASTEHRQAEADGATTVRKRPPGAVTPSVIGGEKIVYTDGRRPVLPKFETTPVIDIRDGSKALASAER